MAKIAQLPPINDLDGSETLIIEQDGVTRQGTLQQVLDGTRSAYTTALMARLKPIEESARVSLSALYAVDTVDTDAWNIAVGFEGVAFVANGADLLAQNPNGLLAGIRPWLQAGAGSTRLAVSIYRRLMTDSNLPPAFAPSDRILQSFSRPLASLGLVAGGAMAESPLTFEPLQIDASYCYVIVIEAFDDGDGRKRIGFGAGFLPAGASPWLRGFYRGPSDPNYTAISSPPNGSGFVTAIACIWLAPTYANMNDVQADIDIGLASAAKLDRSFPDMIVPHACLPGDGSHWNATDGIKKWGYALHCGPGLDIEPGAQLDMLASDFDIGPAVDYARLDRWVRNGAAVTPPGLHVSDRPLPSVFQSRADADQPDETGDLVRFAMDLGSPNFESGKTYIFQWSMFDENGNELPSGASRDDNIAGRSADQRGWFNGDTLVPSPAAIQWTIGQGAKVAPPPSLPVDTQDRIGTATAFANGYAVTVQGQFLRGAQPSEFKGTVMLAAPFNADKVDEPRTLAGVNAHRAVNTANGGSGRLDHFNTSAIVVKDAASSAELVRGVDYSQEPVTGGVARATEGALRNVLVSYHYSKLRYDLICLHAESKELAVFSGPERDRDAGEFLPKATSSVYIPLFYASVADGYPIELVAVWDKKDGIHRDLVEAERRAFANMRQSMPNVMARAYAGLPITLVFMGTSILAMANGTPPRDSANGQLRDRTGFLLENIDEDVVNGLPTYDLGDGAGNVHIKISLGHRIAHALSTWGSPITVHNLAIGGSNSGGEGIGNGKDPTLRATAWGYQPHLTITDFAMNEIGSDNTEGDLRDLIEDAFAHQSEVLVIGCWRPNPTWNGWSLRLLRKTWRAVRRAAEFVSPTHRKRAAYFPMEYYMEDKYAGVLGVAPKEYCGSNDANHPGIAAHAVIGQRMEDALTARR